MPPSGAFGTHKPFVFEGTHGLSLLVMSWGSCLTTLGGGSRGSGRRPARNATCYPLGSRTSRRHARFPHRWRALLPAATPGDDCGLVNGSTSGLGAGLHCFEAPQFRWPARCGEVASGPPGPARPPGGHEGRRRPFQARGDLGVVLGDMETSPLLDRWCASGSGRGEAHPVHGRPGVERPAPELRAAREGRPRGGLPAVQRGGSHTARTRSA